MRKSNHRARHCLRRSILCPFWVNVAHFGYSSGTSDLIVQTYIPMKTWIIIVIICIKEYK